MHMCFSRYTESDAEMEWRLECVLYISLASNEAKLSYFIWEGEGAGEGGWVNVTANKLSCSLK